MLTVKVTFKGYLKQYTGKREPVRLELVEGATVGTALNAFKVPENLIKLTSIAGNRVALDHKLADGDNIDVHPVVLGG